MRQRRQPQSGDGINSDQKSPVCVVYLLPENHTDKVQPIDAGYGKMIKKKIGEQMEKWLEKEENLEMWHDGIPAKTRRVLMTKMGW